MKTPGSTRSSVVVPLLFFWSVIGYAQVPAAKEDSIAFKSLSLAGYPYVFYSPETRFAFGGALVGTYRGTADTELMPSNAVLSAYYSVKNQYQILFQPEIFFEGKNYYLTGFLYYARIVDKFWGVGNSTPDIPDPDYVRSSFAFNVDFEYILGGGLHIGVNYELNHTIITDKQSNPFLLGDAVAGSNGGLSSGVGLVLSYDGRDNVFWPLTGGFYKLTTLSCEQWLGSDFTFSRIIADIRQYAGLGAGGVLAFNLYGSRVAGTTPFYQMPLLGGGYVMRGYYQGRFRDAYYIAGQAEYRIMFTQRWGAVAFIGAGEVGPALSSLQITTLKPSYGFGIRFALDPKERLNVRMDISFGSDTDGTLLHGLYFNAKEAF